MAFCDQCADQFQPTKVGQRFCVGKGCRQKWHNENPVNTRVKNGVTFDTDHPVPTSHPSCQNAFIKDMKPGDSIYIECNADKKEIRKKRTVMTNYANRNDIKLVTRVELTGVRVWRKQEETEEEACQS